MLIHMIQLRDLILKARLLFLWSSLGSVALIHSIYLSILTLYFGGGGGGGGGGFPGLHPV